MTGEKPRIRQVLVVEGRYDAAALTNAVDALILTTDGFGIFKDKETQSLLKELGRQRGVIVLTDPDAAGFRIRRFVADLVGAEHVRHAYVPAVEGKEKRKAAPGKEGLLGVGALTCRRFGRRFCPREGRRPPAARDASSPTATFTPGAFPAPPAAGKNATPF